VELRLLYLFLKFMGQWELCTLLVVAICTPYEVYVPPVVTMCTMCFNIVDKSLHDVVPRQTLIFSFIHFISFDCKSLP